MSSQLVQPLRIQKGTSGNSPTKMASATNRTLAEVSPMAIRRNSPSFPHGNKSNMFKSSESSPFESSPFNTNQTASSPRLFWQGRDPASPVRGSNGNGSPFSNASPSPTKRGSIENLKKASRVKNSSIFSLEEKFQYDPAKPNILDGRPLKAPERPESPRKENFAPVGFELKPEQVEVTTTTTLHSQVTVAPLSPSKNNLSPTKSSMAKKTGANTHRSGFNPETGIWSDDEETEKKLPEGRGLHRRGKSVTFDQAPPQVNEYEMTTPDPSVASSLREGSYDSMDDDDDDDDVSFERGSSFDREDSFDASLEDTDKTPVVLPEDWRFMTPGNANTELCDPEDDVLEEEYGSPAPTALPNASAYRPQQSSVNSVDSNGQARPLPPLPPMTANVTEHRDSLSGTVERISSGQRSLPSPPQAANVSKNDIRRMSGSNFSLEDRLRLMMVNDSEHKSEAEKQRERRMRRAGSKESSPVRGAHHSRQMSIDEGVPGPAVLHDTNAAPRISRNSILRGLRSEQDLNESFTTDEASILVSCLPRHLPLDPDVPIPSLEDPTQHLSHFTESKQVIIKEEEVDDNELYSIPDLYSRRAQANDEDVESEYSQMSMAPSEDTGASEGNDTPRATSPAREPTKKSVPHERVSLPDFMDFGESSSFLDLGTYMTPPVEKEQEESEKALPQLPKETFQTPEPAALPTPPPRPQTPELQPPSFMTQDEPGTPESVIRHQIEPSPLPEVPEAEATIKAPGSDMKARPSFNPAEVEEMAFTRRKVSQTMPPPPVPEAQPERPSLAAAEPQDSYMTASEVPINTEGQKPKRKSSLIQLEIPRDQSDEGLGFGLEKEFDRVVEAQKVQFELSLQRLYHPFHGRFPPSELPGSKDIQGASATQFVVSPPTPRGARALPGDLPARGYVYPTDGNKFANRSPERQRGYLMRQNTKVVVASERNTSEETKQAGPTASITGSSTGLEVQAPAAAYRKISQPTWTAEPWNPKSRRRSIRTAGEDSPKKKKPADGPAPPLPGQASNVQNDLGAVVEDEIAEEEAEDFEDGAERGRLFVKVVGIKDLDLPLPNHERTSFALTLDNGLHCVTTAWLDLNRSAPIGQEFELVVLNELEFQLTLQMKLEEPKIERPSSPTKAPSSPTKKQGAFGRFFGSPKKRKESELRAQQEAHAEKNRPVTPPSAFELVQGLVAKDGSFARAYVALSEHEKQAFGRPYSVDIVCFNEWAMEEVNVGSSRSKKSVTQLQRRPPYPIGKLELQLLYIPKPKNAKDEDMPKSMNSAVRELRDAEARLKEAPKEFEGYLSQQGGDCPYWRRRFFKLVGPKLTAYHETTLQPRATINLAKAAKLIDDKSQLMQKEISTKGGGRRKSAFAEEEDGYMYLEEGFRVRFANGEVIDFYAESVETKDEWMKALTQVVGKAATCSTAPIKGWTEMVLKREKTVRKHVAAASSSKARKEVPRSDPMPSRPVSAPKSTEQASSGPALQHPGVPPRSSIPTPSSRSPTRPAHGRTESHPAPNGSRSTANSPVKSKISKEERQKKTRSMIDMQWR